MTLDTRREEDVLNLLEQLKPHVRPEGEGVYRRLERGFAEFTTEVSALKMSAADPGIFTKWTGFGLTPRQSDMMVALERAGDKGLTFDGLMSAIYGDREWPNENLLKVQMHWIRKTLRGKGWSVETVYGRGYRLCKGEAPEGDRRFNNRATARRYVRTSGQRAKKPHDLAAGGY